jgi:hypothetical protein
MPEPQQPEEKKPETLNELTQELDKNVLSPEVVSVEAEDDTPDLPPGPRDAGPNTPAPRVTEPEPIDEDDLKEAASATEDEEASDADAPESKLNDRSLHVEANPDTPRPHFWRRKKFWFSLIFLLILGLALVWFIRPTRLLLVNALGLRADMAIATITLPDDGQQSSLIKNVKVDINGAQWQSDEHGLLNGKAPYGDVTFTAKKAGYQDATKTISFDFDPFFYLLGGKQDDDVLRKMNLQLKAVGVPLKFQAKDWLTGNPIVDGAFSVGDVVAKPDSQGLVSLTLPATDDKTVQAKAVFGGKFTDKEFELKLDGSVQAVTFVPEGKHYFISNRSGGLAVYSANIDGSEITEVVPASANETSAMNIAISPSGKYGVLASTRDGKRDAQGTLLQQLYVIDLANKKMTSIDQGSWFDFIDWSGDTLVYTLNERKAGASANTQRLSSINVTTVGKSDISSAPSFGQVRVADGSALYQVIVPPSDPAAGNSPELRVTPLKGGTEKSLGYKVQQLAQVDFDRFAYQVGDGTWHEYNVNTSQVKTTSAPANPDRVISAAPTIDGQNKLLLDRVDGKPAIVVKNVAGSQEKQLYAATGIRAPIRIVEDTIIFRISDGSQTADYAISLSGGTPKKITDVTASVAPFATPGYLTFY